MDSDEVRKRKEYAERKVKERHAALRKEAEERRKHTVEHRERVQSQLKREQVLLQKRMQQLNEDEERKKVTLAKQHEATSRIAAITKSPKSFAFGSSTPRTLAYLDNLPKSEQQYDKKLRPLEGSLPATSPIATSPTAKSARHMLTPSRAPPAAHKPAPTMTSMTSSMYVTSSAPPTRHAKTSIKPATTAATSKRLSQGVSSMMTQSVYTPTSRPATSSRLSMARQNRGSTPTSSRATPPVSSTASSRRSLNVQKPPAPRRSIFNAKEVQKTAAVTPLAETADVDLVPTFATDAALEETQIVEEAIEKHIVAPIVEEASPEPAENREEDIIPDETPREIEKEEVIPEVLAVEAVEPVVEEKAVEEIAYEKPEAPVEAIAEIAAEELVQEAEEKVIIPSTEPVEEAPAEIVDAPVPEALNIASEVHVEEREEVATHEEPEKEELISLAHETSESNAGSSVNTSLADELFDAGIQQNHSHDPIEPSKPEVMELKYPLPEVNVAANNAANDLVDVFGNDFINENPPQRIVNFDEDTDSGKASPTSSETSSTTDEVTPRSVIEEVKPVAPRVLPLVRSAEDIARKEKEARETEERKNRLAEILAKTRGMPPPASSIGHLSSSTITNSTQSPVTSPPTPPSPMPSATEQVLTANSSSSSTIPAKSEESTEKISNESGSTSDVLARVAAKTNLPSLQKILQRKQGSNPSLQTSESTGGEIY